MFKASILLSRDRTLLQETQLPFLPRAGDSLIVYDPVIGLTQEAVRDRASNVWTVTAIQYDLTAEPVTVAVLVHFDRAGGDGPRYNARSGVGGV